MVAKGLNVVHFCEIEIFASDNALLALALYWETDLCETRFVIVVHTVNDARTTHFSFSLKVKVTRVTFKDSHFH